MYWKKGLSILSAIGILATSWLGGTGTTHAQEIKLPKPKKEKYQYENLSNYFTGYDGTFVLFDLKQKEYTIYNKKKSEKRVSPNSTFKVPHALIGLQTGVLKDENTTFKWDGTIYPFPEWNQDQNMSRAIKNSTIWYFQEVAKRVGEKNEKKYLHKLHYGNQNISGGLTNFWLQSSLAISPKEQVEFLKKFYTYQLPISKRNIDIVKQALVLEEKNKAVLSGKTGTGWKDAQINGIPINGTFIGYVEKDNNTYLFATNIEAADKATSGKAKEITLKILHDKKIYN
ncbi:Beta-lactamase class D [Seinonella peptonophila]|uniref:Beta-lactamase n=1 Tax=Seinonella peptonophila TaxID=112248 RepID=A0A1M5BD51_9BACL|nr:class D beta-lactamase [Seinonella peptonophila]SHF40493.1 Beta-lactamase class D [Seinonella peptonophila]